MNAFQISIAPAPALEVVVESAVEHAGSQLNDATLLPLGETALVLSHLSTVPPTNRMCTSQQFIVDGGWV